MNPQELLQYWASLFPDNPISEIQAEYWLTNFTSQIILDSIAVTYRKHGKEPMTLSRFCGYATGVMRNKAAQMAVLPPPVVKLCKDCGRPISEHQQEVEVRHE